jgi:hypothetical protein
VLNKIQIGSLLLKNNYSTSCHINRGVSYKKIKLEAFFSNNIVAQNNGLLGVTCICSSKLKLVALLNTSTP